MLAEYTFTSGNFPTITRVLLGKIDTTQDTKMSYVYDQHVFHYIVENGIIYMCMADDVSRRRIPFAFLDDIKTKFQQDYGASAHSAIAFSMNEEFGRVLQRQVDFFNGPNADNFAVVNSKLDDVKNIEMVLERGEKLDLLVDRTEQLSDQAYRFERGAKKLKDAMFWRKVKTYVLIFFVVALIIYIISAIACGPTYKKC